MMHYITQVENRHIVEAEGKNYEVKLNPPYAYSCLNVTYNADNRTINASFVPFTQVVLAVQLCTFVQRHFEGGRSKK